MIPRLEAEMTAPNREQVDGASGKRVGPDRQGAIDAVFTIQVQFPEGHADALIGCQ